MKRSVLAAVSLLLVGGLLGAAASAATGWRVFATASDQGEYGTYASANAKVLRPKGLAIRVTGPVESVSWLLSCSGEVERSGLSGKLVAVSVASAKSCDVYGTGTGAAGTLRVQLLRR